MSEQQSKQEPNETGTPLLSLESVSVEFVTKEGLIHAIRDVSLEIERGETYGIAGESGSGKSTLALATLQYLGENGRITSGSIQYKGRELRDHSKKELQSIRGREIAHVPQDSEKSLNPSIRVGEQIAETVKIHQNVSKKQARARAHELLAEVNIPDPEFNAKRYPHELSGGMQQRILIAMALSCNPELLILDEPTTGLDVTTEAKILDLLEDLKQRYETTILLITHDLGVIAQIADQVGIMYAGEIMERGSVYDIFSNPANPYTQGLLAAIPSVDQTKDLESISGQIPSLMTIPDGCIFADRCPYAESECRNHPIQMEDIPDDASHQTRCRRWETVMESPIQTESTSTESSEAGEVLLDATDIHKYFGDESFFDRLFGGDSPVKAVNGVDFDICESETVSLVGESGCGKSTLGKSLLQLLDVTDGTITYRGEQIASLEEADLKDFRSDAQIVFQNPDSSLNPQRTISETLARSLKRFTDKSKAERRKRIEELLEQVELGPEYADRYPHELSGGEKQRVAIARAFAVNPSFVVLDEPVSALDVSVQASILNLLRRLRREYGASYLFISHDLSVVNHISDRIVVMYLGEIVEAGSKQAVFEPPYHPYTEVLLSSVPLPDPKRDHERIHIEGDVPSARNPPSGCPFHTRCPKKIGDICENEAPLLEEVELSDDETHRIACHLDEEDMISDLTEMESE